MNKKYVLPTLTKVPNRNKKFKKIENTIYILILIIIIINTIGFYFGGKVFTNFFKPNTNNTISLYDRYKSNFDEKKYLSIQNTVTDYAIRSIHGYNLHFLYIKNPVTTKNTVIIVHDLGGSVWSVMEYSYMYLDKGFNVVILDSRNHGKSGGKDVSYGYYEKDDLDNLVTWVYENKNKNEGIIGIHGIGLGADTALMQTEYNEKNHRVKFYIIDSPYDTLSNYFISETSSYYGINKTALNKIPLIKKGLLNTLLFYTNKYGTAFKSNFSIYDVSILNYSRNNTTPIMFICGDLDTVTPKSMSEALYNNTKASKELYISHNAVHCNSFDKNKIEYMKKVNNFIDSTNLISK